MGQTLLGAPAALVNFGKQWTSRFRKPALSLAKLSPYLASVQELSGHSEQYFSRLASSVHQVHSGAIEVAETLENSLAGLRSTISQTNLGGRSGLAAQARAQLDHGIREAQDMLDALEKIERDLAELSQRGQDFQKLGVGLEVCRSAFRVDCGRNEAHALAFHGFTEDLQRLAQQLTGLGESIETESRQAKTSTASELQRLRSSLSSLRGLLERSAQASTAAMENLADTLASVGKILDDTDRACKQLRKSARAATYSMQYGDILRQQLEHIAQALAWAQHRSPRATTDHQPALEQLFQQTWSDQQWPHLLHLESAQLDAAWQSAQAAQQDLSQVLSALDDAISTLEQSLTLSLPLDQLIDSIAQLAKLDQSGRQIRQEAADRYQTASATAARLATHLATVEDLNHRMHLQALNAIVKSETIGSGGVSLSVLSMHVHSLYLNSNQLVARTAEALGRVSQGTSNQPNNAPQSTAAPAESLELDQLLTPLRGLAHEIEATRLFQSRLTELRQNALASCRHQLPTLHSFAEEIAFCADGLRQAQTALPSAQEPWDLDHLEPLYTMASERQVHEECRSHAPPA